MAFFACLYYAGTRPSKTVELRADLNLDLPVDDGWGTLYLHGNAPTVGAGWSRSGRRRDPRAWQGARLLAFTPAVAASPLAERPYDLQHAGLSTWLNTGVDQTQAAEWARNSVEVLLRVYAKCIHGRDQINRKLIDDALRDDEEGD